MSRPSDEQLWEAIGLRDKFIDDLRAALAEAIEEVNILSDMANVALPTNFYSWRDLVRPAAKPTRLR